MSPFLYALVVAWAVTSAVICGVWLYRYLREMAYQRELEARYATAWQAAHWQHQDRDRFTTDRPGAPE